MPYCTYQGCHSKNIDLPLEKFLSPDGTKVFKRCLECREMHQGYLERSRNGTTVKGANFISLNARGLIKGSEPQFASEGHREMYEEWLKGLVRDVLHS